MGKQSFRSAIPTKYAGVQFRSRLEARWAVFFDLAGWTWEYEPLDLAGYIPDFVVAIPAADAPLSMLIEVKPALKLTDYHEAQDKILASGWQGNAACVGAMIGTDDVWIPHNEACIGTILDSDSWTPWTIGTRDGVVRRWREAGNRVQWRSPAPLSVVEIPRITPDARHEKISGVELERFFHDLAAELDA